MNRTFTEETQASNKHVKRCSNLSVSMELEMKATTSCLTLLRLTNTRNLEIMSVPKRVEGPDFTYLQWGASNGTPTLEGKCAAFGEVENSCSCSLQPDSFKAEGKGVCSPGLHGQCLAVPGSVHHAAASQMRRTTMYGDSSLSGI